MLAVGNTAAAYNADLDFFTHFKILSGKPPRNGTPFNNIISYITPTLIIYCRVNIARFFSVNFKRDFLCKTAKTVFLSMHNA